MLGPTYQLVQPNPTRIFRFDPILGQIFGFKRVGLALRIPKQVGLTSKRVQIWIQPYNVFDGPDLFSVSDWALRVQNQVESCQVGPQGKNLIRVGLVGFIWPTASPINHQSIIIILFVFKFDIHV